MIEPRLFACSKAEVPAAASAGRRVIELDAIGDDANVTIRIQDVARVFQKNLPPRMLDLLEIAAYVYTADAGTSRRSEWLDGATEQWQRDLRFVIPVRDRAFWAQPEVCRSLTSALAFLSNDAYAFDFVPLTNDRTTQGYLELGDEHWPFRGMERVLLFSGGLDSLAGAVESATNGQPLVLVSHRPVGQISSRQRKLFAALKKQFPSVPMLHVPVWVNKAGRYGHEPTQRTRSFLFTALGLVVSKMVGAQGIRFYENGVVSLNLPVADEVVRARASRTTHPHALRLLGAFASLVADYPVNIDNPFQAKTKGEVIRSIAENGAGPLIGLTVSCAHTIFKTAGQQHCGTCSQCIDRRIGILAAGLAECDPDTDYETDVFTGSRADGYERAMAIHYVRHAMELRKMSEGEFASRFNVDLARAIRYEPNSHEAAERIYQLHQRHASDVDRVLSDQMRVHAGALVGQGVDSSSMVGLIAGQHHKEPMWEGYVRRLGDVLQAGLPKACASHPAKNEPHLQEIADGILVAQADDLVREFPFMRWSASLTKPDWSHVGLSLWVELKYVRKKQDIRQITEDIAADITKYGDNGRRVFFVVYDPKHLILDEAKFSAPIVARPTMRVRFLR